MNQNESPIQWAAKIQGVREVSLYGEADLLYWSHLLMPLGLIPANHDGKARVVIIAATARFKGVPFREVSFSIALEPHSGRSHANPIFLLGAFNSLRFFAWVERKHFLTPYAAGKIEVACSPHPCVRLVTGHTTLLADMHCDSAGSDGIIISHENWGGPVCFLSGSGGDGILHYFHAEISGEAWSRDFNPLVDRFSIDGADPGSFLFHLEGSGLRPTRWLIRKSARHAKSKTYRSSNGIGSFGWLDVAGGLKWKEDLSKCNVAN